MIITFKFIIMCYFLKFDDESTHPGAENHFSGDELTRHTQLKGHYRRYWHFQHFIVER